MGIRNSDINNIEGGKEIDMTLEENIKRFETYDKEYQKKIIDLGMRVADIAWVNMP